MQDIVLISIPETTIRNIVEEAVRRVISEQMPQPANALDPNELLTRKASAQEFGVCPSTLDNYRRQGLITPCRIRGTVRYKRSELIAAFSGNIFNNNKSPRQRSNANRGTKISK